MEKLYIIDASGFLYRSYFAIKNITNDKGESTNALYGFIRSILKLRKDFNPKHLIAVFDGPQSIQHRASYYPDYKANRAKTPADLSYQIGWAQQACELMGIPFLAVPGLEADDTMGSIALWAAQQDAHVYLCTSDKDMCQIVNDKISILNVHKDNLILGPKEVEEHFGVPPSQIIDYLAMIGDASDNIPGLPSFGPKTAVTLLKEHGSLEYILDHPEVVSGKKREIITEFRDLALLSKRLVILHTTVDFQKSRDFFSINPPPTTPLKEFYARMNFNSLLRELEASSPQSPSEVKLNDSIPISYALVDDEASFNALLAHISEQTELGIHTIMTEEQPLKAQLVGIGLCTSPQRCYYVPVNGKLSLQCVIDGLKKVLESPYIDIYGHNIKSDIQILGNYGIHIPKVSFDTMLASYLLNSHRRQHELEQIVLELYGKALPKLSDLLGKGKNALSLEALPLDDMMKYCCEYVDYIARLKGILKAQLEARGLSSLLNDLELPLLSVLAEMERNGIFLDIPCLEAIAVDVMRQITALEHEIYSLAGETFNLNSPKQLSAILFEKMGIKAPKKNATGLSTNVDVLEALKEQYPIAGKILEYRTVEKLRSTYIDAFPAEVNPKTQRIHCTFNQSVAATGRLSCQHPNLQNIPIKTEAGRKIRTAFRPQKEGWSYLTADYSQIELRLLAHLSEDPTLIDAFNSGEDIHVHTAANIFNIPLSEVTKEQRRSAKAVNFGVIYGQQAFGLAQEIGTDVKVAAAFIEAYFKRYDRVKEFLEACKEQARQTGRSVTYTGRERLIPEIHNKNGQIRALAERLAVNTPLQGTAADLIKLAMLEIDKKMKEKQLKGFLILQIHDELIFELPNEEIPVMEPLVREAMQGVFKLKVPLVVDIELGKNWAEC